MSTGEFFGPTDMELPERVARDFLIYGLAKLFTPGERGAYRTGFAPVDAGHNCLALAGMSDQDQTAVGVIAQPHDARFGLSLDERLWCPYAFFVAVNTGQGEPDTLREVEWIAALPDGEIQNPQLERARQLLAQTAFTFTMSVRFAQTVDTSPRDACDEVAATEWEPPTDFGDFWGGRII